MTDDSDLTINLNPPARKPVPDAPWDDDALQRQGIASRLDALVNDLAGGAEPATIALDGGYGTGKTFILERWVQEMQDRGQIAVYYNAWENDCDDDPLVSLIETLASNDKTNWRGRTLAAVDEALTGIVRKYSGIDTQRVRRAAKDEQLGGLLDAAIHRRKMRQSLKGNLSDLVDAARANEMAGPVVVIDELDRCRPTFANELMERVKHVLNVSGLVFVFGVNLVALRETVRAVYGNIDVHQYLLRMFTTTSKMPRGVAFSGPASDQEMDEYLQGLADRHGLRAFCDRHMMLRENLDSALNLIHLVASAGRLTPRELERVIWLLGKSASSSLFADGTASAMLPLVLVPLAIARVKDPDAYYETVSHPDRAPAVINCLFDLIHEASLHEYQIRHLDRVEMTMYRICHQHPPSNHASAPPAYLALHKFADENSTSTLDDQHLSHRSTGITKERAQALLEAAPPENAIETARGTVAHVTWTFATLRRLTSRFDTIWPRDQA